jgi:hypothetical protein
MLFDFEIAGLPELKKYWGTFTGNFRRRAGHGAYFAAARILKFSNDMVPHRTGNTRDSGKVSKGTQDFGSSSVGEYTISYDTEYAWKIHESTWVKFRQPGETLPGFKEIPPSDRGRQAKFLEKAAAEVSADYVDIVGDEIRKFLANQPTVSSSPSGRPPMLVKKGTSSGGATRAVTIRHEPEPPSGSKAEQIAEIFKSETEG